MSIVPSAADFTRRGRRSIKNSCLTTSRSRLEANVASLRGHMLFSR